ncbi:ABC transporter ATP-binding protein, partial [Candidatus Bathyarchaeota archaeon]|nr:ABC transporter ATP-binding protein [Candidatus Bathyarchaeota archaeon]
GAGKTTTMRCILDYLRIQSGTITVFGLDHHQDALTIRERIGYLPGELALYENFTGDELIEYYNNFRPVNQNFLKELKSIFRVDLTLKIKSLSTGNLRRVGLILALASKPDFIILDEPTTSLDPLMAANVHIILKKLKGEGKTIFLSSHNLAEVQAICDRVGIIKEGRMILVEEIGNLVAKFLQNVKIKFSPSTSPSEENFKELDSVISIEKIDKTTFRLKIKEDVNKLLQWLKTYEIERLIIEDATLEEIFLQYYE